MDIRRERLPIAAAAAAATWKSPRLMHPTFASMIQGLQPSLDRLLACTPHSGRVRLNLKVPASAVYLFTEAGEHLYVGRTDRLRARHREHWTGRANDAPFAFKLARAETAGSVPPGLTRRDLFEHPIFAEAFRRACERVAAAEFRWVEEADANRQCLLEIYATVALGARHNDFINH